MNEELVTENLALIGLAIKQLNLRWDSADEYQYYYDEGLEGLIRGAQRWDESKGYKPSTFLLTCIKNQIKRGLYLKTMPKRFNPNGKDISLNMEIIDDESNPLELISVIPDPDTNIEEEIEKKLDYQRILAAIESLKNKEDREVIKYSYGLMDGKEYSYRDIGKKMGISFQRVEQRKRRAIEKLQKILKTSDFNYY